jgi:hypothetical protein
MANGPVDDAREDLGYECHDCGERYAPGADISPCANDGHYVGPLVECAIPVAKPLSQA